jgi:hypothetical protein
VLPCRAHLRSHREKLSSLVNDCCIDVGCRRNAFARLIQSRGCWFDWFIHALAIGWHNNVLIVVHHCTKLSHQHRREKRTMNGESKREIALGALALGIGVALGAVLGNDTTRKSLVDKGKNWINAYRQN